MASMLVLVVSNFLDFAHSFAEEVVVVSSSYSMVNLMFTAYSQCQRQLLELMQLRSFS